MQGRAAGRAPVRAAAWADAGRKANVTACCRVHAIKIIERKFGYENFSCHRFAGWQGGAPSERRLRPDDSIWRRSGEFLHVVDLDGAKDGDTPNFQVVKRLAAETGLKVEIGGGIRSEETIRRYIDAGVYRVILGTVAVKEPEFTTEMIKKYKEKIGVYGAIIGKAIYNGAIDLEKAIALARSIEQADVFAALFEEGGAK